MSNGWVLETDRPKKTQLICFRLTKLMEEGLNLMVTQGYFVSRAEAIRVAIDGLLAEEGVVGNTIPVDRMSQRCQCGEEFDTTRGLLVHQSRCIIINNQKRRKENECRT